MPQDNHAALEIQRLTGLQPKHFADLIRTAQLVYDPTSGLSGRLIQVNWNSFGISQTVVEDLRKLGERYRYSSPYVAIEAVWRQISPETRSWFIENRNHLWRLEETFPALDED